MLFTQLLPNELLDVAAHVLVARRQWTGVRTEQIGSQIGSQIGKRGLMNGIARNELELEFSNGERRVFDVKPYLGKGIFRQLKHRSYFASVRANPR